LNLSSPQHTPQRTVGEALAEGRAMGLDRLDLQLLMLHALGLDETRRAWLLAHDDEELANNVAERFLTDAKRRAQGEPLAYITGTKEFFGLPLRVDARVLVPRPDTETLVDWALELMPQKNARVIDLGTGSGAIALALKHARPDWDVHALDASADALAVAQANAANLGLSIQFHQGFWLSGLRLEPDPTLRFGLIASNPPYIEVDDPHLAALTHEPLQALVAGADGLDDLRHIISQARIHLRDQGWLVLEHGYQQAAAVRELLLAAGFSQVQSRRDLAGIERCSGGMWLATD
jgi:release factor glutamine methyltransferase